MAKRPIEDAIRRELIGIAGAGRMGQALGKLLRDRGQPVVAVAGRNAARAQTAAVFIGPDVQAVACHELPARVTRVLIAVPDDAVAAMAQSLAAGGMATGAAIHICGTHGVEVLAPLAAAGVSCAALHPLQTVSTPEQGVTALPGASFAITGEGSAAAWAESIVALLDGHLLPVPPGSRSVYHAAAVMASNYIVALIDAAVTVMSAAGIEPERALQALAPLIRASTENALVSGPLHALTGPVERGDVQTVAAHLAALAAARLPPEVLQLYRAAGMQALRLARERGLPATAGIQLEELLKG